MRLTVIDAVNIAELTRQITATRREIGDLDSKHGAATFAYVPVYENVQIHISYSDIRPMVRDRLSSLLRQLESRLREFGVELAQ